MRRMQALGVQAIAVGQDDLSDRFNREGFAYARYPLTRRLNPWEDRLALRSLEAIFRELNPDIIHSFNTKPNLLATLAAKVVPRAKVVRTVTGMGPLFSGTGIRNFWGQLAYRQAQRAIRDRIDKHIFQNQDDQSYFAAHRLASMEKSVLVRGSGIEIEDFPRVEYDPDAKRKLRNQLGLGEGFTVIMISRFIRSKGIEEYSQAAEIVRGKEPHIQFLLVGQPVWKAGTKLAKDTVMPGAAVTCLGPRNDIAQLLAASDVCALPSYREGLPRTLLEASAVGLPLITTDVPGCREVVRDEVNGILVRSRDGAALANAISRLARDHARCRELAEQARSIVVDEFSVQRVAERYVTIYSSLLSRPFGLPTKAA